MIVMPAVQFSITGSNDFPNTRLQPQREKQHACRIPMPLAFLTTETVLGSRLYDEEESRSAVHNVYEMGEVWCPLWEHVSYLLAGDCIEGVCGVDRYAQAIIAEAVVIRERSKVLDNSFRSVANIIDQLLRGRESRRVLERRWQRDFGKQPAKDLTISNYLSLVKAPLYQYYSKVGERMEEYRPAQGGT